MFRRIKLFGLVVFAMSGCVSPQARLQMGEDAELKKDLAVKTVGDIADIRIVGPVQVSGLGLVIGLDGTGGTPQGEYRKQLEQLLGKRKIEHVREILDSPNNAMVVVTAFIPPGARKGDPMDAEVTLPPGSKVTSLAGGTLVLCDLRDHESAKNLSPKFEGADHAISGRICAHAKGHMMLDMGENAGAAEQRRGRIWRGAVTVIDMPFYLELKKDDRSTRVANVVAERMNFLFQEDPQRIARLSAQEKQYVFLGDIAQQMNKKAQPSGEAVKVAWVSGKESVQMRVPLAYRLNPERYIYVSRLVPLVEDADQQRRYRLRLQKLLADPSETVMAARRLEAAGRDSIPALKQGLTHPHPLVRFASAEALAYLGDSSGVDELAKLASQYPIVAGGALAALASLDESGCRERLTELMADESPTLRCAAFTALRQIAERDLPDSTLKTPWGEPYRDWLHKRLGGEKLAGTFWLHRVAAKSAPLVCFAADTRAEVVLFGETARLTTPVRMQVGREFTLTLDPGADRCTVSRFSARFGDQQKACAPALENVIRAMGDMGADYADVIDLIRKLDERDALSCKVRLNIAPPAVSPQMLADWGRQVSAGDAKVLVPTVSH